MAYTTSGNPMHRPQPATHRGGKARPSSGGSGKEDAVNSPLLTESPVPSVDSDGGGGGGGGNSNPWYNQLESMYLAQGAAEAANMRSSIQQMLISFGLVPEGFNDKFGALDETTRALITKNTETGISQYARMLEAKQDGIKNLVNRLNRQGLRRSGAKGYGLRRGALNFDRSKADALGGLMSQIGQMYGAYTSNEYARQAALMQAAMNYFNSSYGSTSGSGGSNGGSGSNASSGSSSPLSVAPGYYGPGQTEEAYNLDGWWAM